MTLEQLIDHLEAFAVPATPEHRFRVMRKAIGDFAAQAVAAELDAATKDLQWQLDEVLRQRDADIAFDVQAAEQRGRESVFKATVEACARTACCHPPKPHYTGVQACCRHARAFRALTLEDIK